MGNDQSQLSGLDIQEKAVEVTDFWAHHCASLTFGNLTSVSVFIGEPVIGGQLWLKQTPLEKSCKNLMIYRHPCILKYISSWHKGSKFHLAVEDVKPLSHVLPSQSSLQICIGLHSILKALCFLHEKASVSHNNVCTASVYVTKDGSWKLGCMEYMCHFKDLSYEYLTKTKNNRYSKAIDPNEDKNLSNKSNRKDFVDVYAFAVLAKEVLNQKIQDIQSSSSFLDLCKDELQNVDITLRPKLVALFEHPFFNHEFITIHGFLTELPLKSDIEKAEFFTQLPDKLKNFDENTVGSQLSGLLLSRMVLLNKTAQTDFIPFLLCPRDDDSLSNATGLFCVGIFKKYLVPKLLEIFCVRDAQIRLLLLDHFVHYMNCFSIDELQSGVLPELLVGIKDTSDTLVAVTLRALADLVPILGSATVIGGKRAKLFNDGRPITHPSSRRAKRTSREAPAMDLLSATSSIETDSINSQTSHVLELPERPSPDGEEDETSTEEVEVGTEEDLDAWEDWDINEDARQSNGSNSNVPNTTPSDENFEQNSSTESEILGVQTSSKRKSLPDISELDIKNQTDAMKTDDFDFFQDMEPVIETPHRSLDNLMETGHDRNEVATNLKFGVAGDEGHVEGWGEDSDWE